MTIEKRKTGTMNKRKIPEEDMKRFVDALKKSIRQPSRGRSTKTRIETHQVALQPDTRLNWTEAALKSSFDSSASGPPSLLTVGFEYQIFL